MKELIKAEEEKTLFIGRHGNECIYGRMGYRRMPCSGSRTVRNGRV